ncbi:MAG: NADH-quinone oxidoreductase subunit H [Bacteroidales bacterium]|nr:NADH-quinone oxidoreductase subunit H [Bacteroidales bacterium]
MLSFILIIAASLFFSGLVSRTKSICSGRKGPGIFQPLRDAARLFRKGTIYSRNTSFVFRVAPLVYAASVIIACACIPLGPFPALLHFEGDFIFFAYLLSVGKFFCIAAALDTASSFEGMGASRESLYSMLAEPAFFFIMGTLALLTGFHSFNDIFALTDAYSSLFSLGTAISLAALILVIALIESSRLPVDDPKTHLELTMIHEVMILDNSGFDLGLIFCTGYLKFAMYGALIANLFLCGPLWACVLIFFAAQILSAVAVGVTESFMARFRMNHNPEFIFSIAALAFIILISTLYII